MEPLRATPWATDTDIDGHRRTCDVPKFAENVPNVLPTESTTCTDAVSYQSQRGEGRDGYERGSSLTAFVGRCPAVSVLARSGRPTADMAQFDAVRYVPGVVQVASLRTLVRCWRA